MRTLVFQPKAFNEFKEWAQTNTKIHKRILELLDNTLQTPFEGLGKPEALKYNLQGFWSRRIDESNRLVYQVTQNEIIVVSCRYHYDK